MSDTHEIRLIRLRMAAETFSRQHRYWQEAVAKVATCKAAIPLERDLDRLQDLFHTHQRAGWILEWNEARYQAMRELLEDLFGRDVDQVLAAAVAELPAMPAQQSGGGA
jgi:hypothetical protein